jgi:iron complex outermembrane receptor protein
VPYEQHRLRWGGGYRYARDETHTNFNALNPLAQVFIPASRTLHWGNIFVQDEIELDPRVSVVLGVKAESNVYTGVEWLPNARIAWTPNDESLLWGSLSRAVRAPARIDHDFYYYLNLPGRPLIPIIVGGPDFRSEIAYVGEVGYRGQPTSSLSCSVTAFYAFYDYLRSGQPPPAVVQNMMQGSTYGLEAWGTFQAARAWRLSAGMTALGENLRVEADSRDPVGPSALGNDPKLQWFLRSSPNLAEAVEFDVWLRHVGRLPTPQVPAYTAFDARLGWRPLPNLELSVTLRNAFDAHHAEFGAPATASELERAFFVKAVWRI